VGSIRLAPRQARGSLMVFDQSRARRMEPCPSTSLRAP